MLWAEIDLNCDYDRATQELWNFKVAPSYDPCSASPGGAELDQTRTFQQVRVVSYWILLQIKQTSVCLPPDSHSSDEGEASEEGQVSDKWGATTDSSQLSGLLEEASESQQQACHTCSHRGDGENLLQHYVSCDCYY